MLSSSETTKYCKPKQIVSRDEPEETAEPPATMPGASVEPSATMYTGSVGGMVSGSGGVGHCGVDIAFRFDLLLHIKASSGVARAHSAASAMENLQLLED